MSGYQERLRALDTTRYLLKDFLVYGFHMRDDHDHISARTYDNELRRVKSLLGDTLRWDSDQTGKRFFISADASGLSVNPLHRMYRLHTFTDNDILLRFLIPDALYAAGEPLDLPTVLEAVCERSNLIFDEQTVRRKLNEYIRLGIVVTKKVGRRSLYALSEADILPDDSEGLDEWLAFFREAEPFGSLADEIMLRERFFNLFMRFKHHFLMCTLDDDEGMVLLEAMRDQSAVHCRIARQYAHNAVYETTILPVQFRFSEQTGRRYVIAWDDCRKRVRALRMDLIHQAKIVPPMPDAQEHRAEAIGRIQKLWGVSFRDGNSAETLRMTLRIDPVRDGFVLDRIRREGRGGRLQQIGEDSFLYEIEVLDVGEMMEWVKTFIGRIRKLESGSDEIAARFREEIQRLSEMYADEQEKPDA